MNRLFGFLFAIILLVIFFTLSTPVARLGSGFLIGDGRHVLTWYDLVKDSETIKVRFPNEDDIRANMVYKDSTANLAVLELDEAPKVKRKPLVFDETGFKTRDNYVFTLGYPWTNTLEDRHTLIEGLLATGGDRTSGLLEIEMALDPVHSGSPLFNGRQEVVGMVLLASHAADYYPVTLPAENNFAISSPILKQAVKSFTRQESAGPVEPVKAVPVDAFIKDVRNNVVLIEAR